MRYPIVKDLLKRRSILVKSSDRISRFTSPGAHTDVFFNFTFTIRKLLRDDSIQRFEDSRSPRERKNLHFVFSIQFVKNWRKFSGAPKQEKVELRDFRRP